MKKLLSKIAFGRVAQSMLLLTLFTFAAITAGAQTNTFPSSGNAGVGTTTPSDLLELNKSQNSGTTLTIDNPYTSSGNAAYSGFWFKQNGSARLFFGSVNDNNTTQTGGGGAAQLWNFANGPTLFATNNSERMRITSSGNVGIGTASPWSTFTVVAPTGTRNGLTVAGDGNSWVYTDLNLTPIGTIATGKPVNFAWSVRKDAYYGSDSSGPSLVLEAARQDGGTFVPFVVNPNGNLILAGANNATNGNVGIGTTSPTFKLDIAGQVRSSSGGFVFPDGTVQTTAASGGSSQWTGSSTIYYNGGDVGVGTNAPAFDGNTTKYLTVNGGSGVFGSFGVGGNISSTAYPVGQYSFFNSGLTGTEKRVATIVGSTDVATNSGKIDFWTAVGGVFSAPRMSILSNGNVGIGTTNPDKKLVVVDGSSLYLKFLRSSNDGIYMYADGNYYGLNAYDFTNQVYKPMSIGWGQQNLYLARDGGNVGIGTTSPQSNLQIGSQTSGATGTPVVLSLGGSYSSSAGSNLKLKLYDDGEVGNTYGIGVSSGSMDFGVQSSAGYKWYAGGVNKMTLANNGDLSVSGNIAAKYQDVAEWVPAAEQLSAGTVVVLDPTKSNQVTSSTTAYDTRVAGVISAQPGITLGEKSDTKVLVATTGRVRVKVDATKSPIAIGDLLVTSDVAGVAMKSEAVNLGGVQIHRPGTIIGKALEPLAKGSGEILVLLSLQ